MTEAALSTSVRQTREATVKEHIDAENRHDPAATVATFSDYKASYDIPAFGEAGQVPDHDAIRELFVGMFSVFPDFHIEAGPLRHGDDHVFVEIRLSGTQHADWAGYSVNRKIVQYTNGCSIRVRGGPTCVRTRLYGLR